MKRSSKPQPKFKKKSNKKNRHKLNVTDTVAKEEKKWPHQKEKLQHR